MAKLFSDDGEPLAPEDLEWATRFAGLALGLPDPWVAPCGDGSVHLTWFGSDGRRFVLDHKGGRTFFSSRDAAGAYDTGSAGTDETALQRLREFLAA